VIIIQGWRYFIKRDFWQGDFWYGRVKVVWSIAFDEENVFL